MFSNIVSFQRPVNGVPVIQRRSDGYINATALSKAHLTGTGQRRDVSEWLSNLRTKESLSHLSRSTGIPVDLLVNIVSTGRNECRGTYIHPRLATRFAMWLSDDFGFLVEEWVEEWLTTGRNPIDPDFEQQYRQWQERDDVRKCLKDLRRPELMNAVVEWANRHGVSPISLCSKVHDTMNERIQGAKAQQIRAMGGLPLGVLLRDYFEASPLVDYSAINRLAMNDIQDRDVEPVQAVHNACDRYLGKSYAPKLLPIVESVHSQGRRLKAIRQSRQLTAGHQLTLWESDAAS